MKFAITTDKERNEVFQHFGMTQFFTICEAENGKLVSKQLYDASHSGHEALAFLLGDEGVEVLICGGIGGGAKQALQMAGLELVAGVKGNIDDVIEGYLAGHIQHDPNVHCNHHGHHHGGGAEEAQRLYAQRKQSME